MNRVRAGIAVSLLLLAIGGGAYFATRPGPSGDTPPPDQSASVPPPAPVTELAPAPAAPGPIMIEVQGAVVRPGSYSLPDGARIYDAIRRAGGATEGAEIRDINIAARLIDGSVVSIPFRPASERDFQLAAADLNPPAYTRSGWSGSPQPASAQGAPTTAPEATPLVDLNSATQAELETLPGVGPKTAEKIIQFRNRQPFSAVDDLRHVQGIGDTRLETLRPLVTVQPQ